MTVGLAVAGRAAVADDLAVTAAVSLTGVGSVAVTVAVAGSAAATAAETVGGERGGSGSGKPNAQAHELQMRSCGGTVWDGAPRKTCGSSSVRGPDEVELRLPLALWMC